MSLPDLRQFTYQRRSICPSQRSYKCGEGAENDCVDSSFYPHTPNKASINSIPETPPCTGSSRHQVVYLRRDGRRKRYNRLSSSSEGEDGESERQNFTPREIIRSHTPVTIFSKLPASKRKKRALEDGSDDMEGRVVGGMELGCTKETSCAVYYESKDCV